MGRRCSFQRGFGRLAARFQGAAFIAVGGRRSRGGRLASRLGFGGKIIGDGAPLRIQPAKLFGPLRFGGLGRLALCGVHIQDRLHQVIQIFHAITSKGESSPFSRFIIAPCIKIQALFVQTANRTTFSPNRLLYCSVCRIALSFVQLCIPPATAQKQGARRKAGALCAVLMQIQAITK